MAACMPKKGPSVEALQSRVEQLEAELAKYKGEQKEAEPAPKKKGKKKGAKKPAKKPAGAAGMAAMLKQVNQGTKITKGLNKVKKEQKTKNMKNRKATVKTKVKKSKGDGMNPRIEFGAKFGNSIKITDFYEDEIKQPEGLEYKLSSVIEYDNCKTCYMKVDATPGAGKVNMVKISNCKNFQVQLSCSVVSMVEMYNCKSVTVFVDGEIPTVQIDKSESVRITVAKPELKCPKIIVSQVAGSNVMLVTPSEDPSKPEETGSVEHPIPESFELTVPDDKSTLVCKPMTH